MEDSDCVHQWRIEAPNGPVSQGKCKTCGAHGEFRNSIPSSGGWAGDAAKARQARTKARAAKTG